MWVSVFEGFLSTPEMLQVFHPTAVVQAMMDFEAALVRAQGRVGVIPAAAALSIAGLCRAELYDVAALVAASASAGSLAKPVVQKITETVALFDPVAAGFVEWGSGSQDMADTAMVLLTRRALRLIDEDVLALSEHLLDLADANAASPVLARTSLQPSQVSSLRFRLIGWLQPLLRAAQSLRSSADAALLLQFGGEVGTLSGLGEHADAVTAALADELRLTAPDVPWHTQRDRWVRLGSELGVLCGSLGKLARDVSLLSQAEIGEFAEPVLVPTYPQDGLSTDRVRRPAAAIKLGATGCMQALAAAQRVPQRVATLLTCMTQEHERSLGGWQAEQAEWSGLLLQAHGAVRAMLQAMQVLQVVPSRMRRNIEGQHDLVFSEALVHLVAPLLGRQDAQSLVAGLCARVAAGEAPLRVLAGQLPAMDSRLQGRLSAAALDAAFDVDRAAVLADTRVAKALVTAREQWADLIDQPHW